MIKSIKHGFHLINKYANKYGLTDRECNKANIGIGLLSGLCIGLVGIHIENILTGLLFLAITLSLMAIFCMLPYVVQFLVGSFELVKHYHEV